jgi:hypothetical protein
LANWAILLCSEFDLSSSRLLNIALDPDPAAPEPKHLVDDVGGQDDIIETLMSRP